MRDLFIADAHLRAPSDDNYRHLLAFLRSQGSELRTLYLLGDIFEFWMGFDHVVYADCLPLLQCLADLRERGVGIVCVEGNHDFNLGPFFVKTLGCTVLPDGGEVSIDGQRVQLVHGDLADPNDRGYRLLRRLLRSGLIRGLSRIVHPDLIWKIAAWASRKSAGKKRRGDSATIAPLLRRYAERFFRAGCDVVVTGHFHQPLCESNNSGTLVALGDWIDQYSYAICEDGSFRLESYSTGNAA